MGSKINTAGNEWAPITDITGCALIFSSNGHGGYGGQDLFKVSRYADGFGEPENLGDDINSAGDDFDAVLLPNNELIFTSPKTPTAKLIYTFAIKRLEPVPAESTQL